jgi:hypothetical protein
MQSTALLTGHLCVFLMVLSYSRFVYLDSQGRLQGTRVRRERPDRVKQAGRQRGDTTGEGQAEPEAVKVRLGEVAVDATAPKAEQKKTSPRTIRIDVADRSSMKPTSATPTTSPEKSRTGESPSSSADQPAAGKRSKAERRRQRELRRKMSEDKIHR